MKAFVSPTDSIMMTVISTFGVLFMVVLGSLYDAEVEGLTESINDPSDPKAVAHSCFIVAGIYALLFVSCGFQAWLNFRTPSDVQIQL